MRAPALPAAGSHNSATNHPRDPVGDRNVGAQPALWGEEMEEKTPAGASAGPATGKERRLLGRQWPDTPRCDFPAAFQHVLK